MLQSTGDVHGGEVKEEGMTWAPTLILILHIHHPIAPLSSTPCLLSHSLPGCLWITIRFMANKYGMQSCRSIVGFYVNVVGGKQCAEKEWQVREWNITQRNSRRHFFVGRSSNNSDILLLFCKSSVRLLCTLVVLQGIRKRLTLISWIWIWISKEEWSGYTRIEATKKLGLSFIRRFPCKSIQ